MFLPSGHDLSMNYRRYCIAIQKGVDILLNRHFEVSYLKYFSFPSCSANLNLSGSSMSACFLVTLAYVFSVLILAVVINCSICMFNAYHQQEGHDNDL